MQTPHNEAGSSLQELLGIGQAIAEAAGVMAPGSDSIKKLIQGVKKALEMMKSALAGASHLGHAIGREISSYDFTPRKKEPTAERKRYPKHPMAPNVEEKAMNHEPKIDLDVNRYNAALDALKRNAKDAQEGRLNIPKGYGEVVGRQTEELTNKLLPVYAAYGKQTEETLAKFHDVMAGIEKLEAKENPTMKDISDLQHLRQEEFLIRQDYYDAEARFGSYVTDILEENRYAIPDPRLIKELDSLKDRLEVNSKYQDYYHDKLMKPWEKEVEVMQDRMVNLRAAPMATISRDEAKTLLDAYSKKLSQFPTAEKLFSKDVLEKNPMRVKRHKELEQRASIIKGWVEEAYQTLNISKTKTSPQKETPKPKEKRESTAPER